MVKDIHIPVTKAFDMEIKFTRKRTPSLEKRGIIWIFNLNFSISFLNFQLSATKVNPWNQTLNPELPVQAIFSRDGFLTGVY